MIIFNLEKAKNIAHNIRRAKRAEEFEPLDIKVTIPQFAEEAEKERQAIRDKYSVIQEKIDLSQTTEDLKKAIGL